MAAGKRSFLGVHEILEFRLTVSNIALMIKVIMRERRIRGVYVGPLDSLPVKRLIEINNGKYHIQVHFQYTKTDWVHSSYRTVELWEASHILLRALTVMMKSWAYLKVMYKLKPRPYREPRSRCWYKAIQAINWWNWYAHVLFLVIMMKMQTRDWENRGLIQPKVKTTQLVSFYCYMIKKFNMFFPN